MNKLFYFLTLTVFACVAFTADAKKSKSDKTPVSVKVWFKDGRVYEGPMVKHWNTYAQSFLASGHNFHTLPDPEAKSVKNDACDTDSILIVSSPDDKWKAGDLYVSFKGLTPMTGSRKAGGKMLRRTWRGRNVEMCHLPYMGNCMRGLRNDDQRMEYWMVRFPKTGDAVVFYDNPLGKGCHKPLFKSLYFVDRVEKFNPGLAQAVKDKFIPDKQTGKEMSNAILEKPELFMEFVDNYLTENPE